MSKLRRSARGQECQLETPHCSHDPAETVLCHGRGAGFGTKLKDFVAIYACAGCHAYLDSCNEKDFDRLFAGALRRTLNQMHYAGLIE